MSSWSEHLAAVRARVREVNARELATRQAQGELLVLDVREPDEHTSGLIPGAKAVPRGLLEQRIEALAKPSQPLAIYCAGGTRSALAADTLQTLGYRDVVSLSGGISAWREAGFPIQAPPDTSWAARFARQIVMPQVGLAGQEKLRAARVLCVGAGGLGSPVALYLAAAGIGTLGLIDDDKVDLSNLQRQILHDELWVGRPKTDSATDRLTRLNRELRVEAMPVRLTASNALELLSGWDVVVDGTDNFETRYLINDACVLNKIPNVHGAILHFDGQVAVYNHANGPCYRCLHPSPPPAHLAPSCAEAGVIGAVCGVVGSLQAVEVVKLILGVGQSLAGRLLSIDLLNGEVRGLKVRRDPDCPLCGEAPTITTIDPVSWTCGYHPF
jgi:molybdopterin/thiamine biosynthesis adenylyltransferase/rhodanese-related sulfurtransferase